MTNEANDPPTSDAIRGSQRAARRAQSARMRVRAQQVARLFGISGAECSLWAKKNADNLKMCSCWMCGHVRRTEGPPVSERRRMLREKDSE